MSVPGCPPVPREQPNDFQRHARSSSGGSSSNSDAARPIKLGDGSITLSSCDGSKSQQWVLTSTSNTSRGSLPSGTARTKATAVKSLADGGCWEIDGCSSSAGAAIDTDYGCKKIPVPGWKNHSSPCVANMAWEFHSNDTVTSLMDGFCLQVSEKDEWSINVSPCDGSKRQQWFRNGTTIQSGLGGGCIDNHGGKKPLYPQYGPLVVDDCAASQCGGADHRWTLDKDSGQLVSAVPGLGGETICAQVEGYFNHYSPLTATACAPAADVPRAQKWAIDPAHMRVSVDVRFNASQQRSPGMLLCHDIDFSAKGTLTPGPQCPTLRGTLSFLATFFL